MSDHPPAIAEGLLRLVEREPALAELVSATGLPRSRSRPAGFGTLLQIITGQQVSTYAAAAIWQRVALLASPMTPAAWVGLSDEAIRGAGFSRSKAVYARDLATKLLDGSVDLDGLDAIDDEAAIRSLVAIKGIGRWTAEIYLLFAHGRPDMWPADDIAIQAGYQMLRGLPERPAAKALRQAGEEFRPWRSAAALLLWHLYHHRLRTQSGEIIPG
ncbi:DNA-3-methyladenine glycosylase II [Stella humosa]|uniref:DNA-3-methyladenine glycosylase II n=1 Tax=Stella humosa TaxID=94 RepID=A0A3N1MCC3_9PROT|nr:DNA-3-methyladenine glycosylase [Stella humosa]ROQ01381.1 DNA-3-methyladenine glycosylase II [Stella humosa]BBK31756.1 3-methyladenine DNA glycosylase [Stella humosa]